MRIGTKSVLFGAHCFAYHGIAVAIAWWKLYRWAPALDGGRWPAILDPRAWLVFFFHDIGYWGQPNMDGLEGECHPFTGALLVTRLLGGRTRERQYIPAYGPAGGVWLCPWGMFALLHSRYLTKALSSFAVTSHLRPSRLCAVDKLALTYTPWWLYLPGVVLSGEIDEYMADARARGGAVGVSADSRREWFETMRAYCARWAYEHADGRVDTWTGDRRTGAVDQAKEDRGG